LPARKRSSGAQTSFPPPPSFLAKVHNDFQEFAGFRPDSPPPPVTVLPAFLILAAFPILASLALCRPMCPFEGGFPCHFGVPLGLENFSPSMGFSDPFLLGPPPLLQYRGLKTMRPFFPPLPVRSSCTFPPFFPADFPKGGSIRPPPTSTILVVWCQAGPFPFWRLASSLSSYPFTVWFGPPFRMTPPTKPPPDIFFFAFSCDITPYCPPKKVTGRDLLCPPLDDLGAKKPLGFPLFLVFFLPLPGKLSHPPAVAADCNLPFFSFFLFPSRVVVGVEDPATPFFRLVVFL